MQYRSNKKRVFNRKNIVGFTVVVLILLVSSVVYYVLNKSPDIPFKTNVKNILTLQLDPNNCCVQINDFSVERAGLAIATNEGLFFYDNKQKNTWSKKTDQEKSNIYLQTAVKENSIFAVRTSYRYDDEEDITFLDKFDVAGNKIWSLKLPKDIDSKQLIADYPDQVLINVEFENSVLFENKTNKTLVSSYGENDILKLIVSAKDSSPEIISYTHIGSPGKDGIISSQNNTRLDMLYLEGPSKIENSFIGGDNVKLKPDFPSSQLASEGGHFVCECSNAYKSAFHYIRSIPGIGLVWRGIDTHESKNSTDKATYTLSFSPIVIEKDKSTYSDDRPDNDTTSNYFISMYNESRLIESKLLNSDPPKEVEDKDKIKYIDPQISPALSTAKNSVVVGLETLDGTVKIMRYSKDLSNQKSIDIGKGNLHNIKSFDDSYYAVVYGPESNKATVYKFN